LRKSLDLLFTETSAMRCAAPGSRKRKSRCRAFEFDAAPANCLFENTRARLIRAWPDRKAGYPTALGIAGGVFPHSDLGSPAAWREFFEEIIRENIDWPTRNVQLIFARKMRKIDCGRRPMQTRIVTEGVIPSLHVYYKNTHLNQYHKTGRRGAGLVLNHH